MIKRDLPGYAIGGLSGGEKKDTFWKVVSLCTDYLPKDKPRYCMGVGFPVDMVVCCALGVDMFDCVFPTRTGRFGTALVPWGQLNLKQKGFEADFSPIDAKCNCMTCKTYTRAALHSILGKDPVGCSLITIHNLSYHLSLLRDIRDNISKGSFPQFVRSFMSKMFPNGDYEDWIVDALASVNIFLN
jgi:queuine tRNA-ribosyltransferase